MNFKFLFKTFFIVSIISFIVSCDKDVNEIGADILQNNNHFDVKTADFPVIAYNQKTGAVQSNDLPINSLGIYNNSIFGSTTANFITRLSVANLPTFNQKSNIVVDSVYLYVPYYNYGATANTTSGGSDYTLAKDSIQGLGNKFKLEIYKCNKVILKDDDSPTSNLFTPKKYYTDEVNFFETQLDPFGRLNNDTNVVQNDEFLINNNEIVLYKTVNAAQVVKQRLAPGIFLNLSKTFFQDFIRNELTSTFTNSENFQDKFRALYFKTGLSAGSANGAMARLNFAAGKITILYRDKTFAIDPLFPASNPFVNKILEFNLIGNQANGNTINFFNNIENPSYTAAVSAVNKTLGDEKLYVKGGEGTMSIISLFDQSPNITSNALNIMRNEGWLINDASVTFYIDTSTMGSIESEPKRIYLYDLNNNKPLVDYFFDNSVGINAKYNKQLFGGIISKGANGRGSYYKVRITDYLRSIIKSTDLVNVKLGLVVTESIGNPFVYALKSPFTYLIDSSTVNVKSCTSLPVMNTVNPLGTVLFGNNILPTSPNYVKRVKLQIYYTKPN